MKMASFSNPAGIPLPKDMAVNPMVVETAVEIIPDHVQYERMFKWETDYARVVMFSSIEDESVQKHLVDKYPLSEYNYKGCHAQLLPFLPRQHKSAEKPVAVKLLLRFAILLHLGRHLPNDVGDVSFHSSRLWKRFGFVLDNRGYPVLLRGGVRVYVLYEELPHRLHRQPHQQPRRGVLEGSRQGRLNTPKHSFFFRIKSSRANVINNTSS
ncbi:hypothetical protein B484DRAFT_244703 [Ochromonadaceae sp. CCMP2298]|nr:hypothetical protein B484DRAFT_244703 [Ochromonadaceae sp. CCMP2298]